MGGAGAALVEYEWLLNDVDGTFATLSGPVVSHVFDRAGDFGVSLRVRDAGGKNGYAGLNQAITVHQLYEVAGPRAPLSYCWMPGAAEYQVGHPGASAPEWHAEHAAPMRRAERD